jgi:hypothetical protein
MRMAMQRPVARRLIAWLLPMTILLEACASGVPPAPVTSLDPTSLAVLQRTLEDQPATLVLASGEVVRSADSDEDDHLFRRKATTGRSEATDGALVDRSGRLGRLPLSWFVLVSAPSLLVVAAVCSCENPRAGGGRPGFSTGVGRSGGGWAGARSFPHPGSFHSRGGGLLGGWGRSAPRRAPASS